MNGQVIKSTNLPFGVVVAIKGRFRNQSNKFIVDKIFTPSLAPQKKILENFID
jgi:hypothetical protein